MLGAYPYSYDGWNDGPVDIPVLLLDLNPYDYVEDLTIADIEASGMDDLLEEISNSRSVVNGHLIWPTFGH